MAGLQNASRPQQIYNSKMEGDLQSFRKITKIITRTKYFVKTQQHNYHICPSELSQKLASSI